MFTYGPFHIYIAKVKSEKKKKSALFKCEAIIKAVNRIADT